MLMWMVFVFQVFAMDVSDVLDPRPGSQIADLADVLQPKKQAAIETALSDIKSSVGVEVMVVTVQSTATSPKSFAVALGNQWGVGDAKLDNGLIILLAMEQRRIEMEQGIGMEEVLPASWLQRMQQKHMVPFFKRGDFAGGLEAGVLQVQKRLKAGVGESEQIQTQPPDPVNVNELSDLEEPNTSPISGVFEGGFDCVEISILALMALFGVFVIGIIVLFASAADSSGSGSESSSYNNDDDDDDPWGSRTSLFDDDNDDDWSSGSSSSGGSFGGGGSGSSW